MLKPIMAAAVAAVLAAAPVTASPARLVDTLQAHGVQVFLDDPECESGVFGGLYNSTTNQMLICSGGGIPQQLTAEQAKILRHEAVHVVQDCHSKGGLQDDQVALLMDDNQLDMMIRLSGIDADAIESGYRMMGADDFVVRIELEAWSLQEVATERDVIDAVNRVCSR